MAEIDSLDVVDASNTARFPEGVAAGDLNDNLRALEGIIARFHEDLGARKSSTGSADAYLFAAAQTLTAYYDGLIIGFDANFQNTGAATLNVDSLGAKTIKKRNNVDLASGDIEVGQKVLVFYDGATFQMLSQIANGTSTSPLLAVLDTGGFAIDGSEGSAVASSATTNIWATDGNTVHITGTDTITSFGTAPRVGAWRKCIADGAFILTDGANLNLPGGANITAEVDDFFFVYAETTTLFKVLYFPVNGLPVVGGLVQVVNTQTGAVATGTTQLPIDDTIPQNIEGDEYMTLAITPKDTSNILLIEVVIQLAASGTASSLTAALFQDATAGALAAMNHRKEVANGKLFISFTHKMTAGTTSATTFKVRAGANIAGTTTFNGSAGSREFGGVMASSITISEIKA